MSFQDDVRKQIARNLDEQAAKQSEKERIEAERLTKMLDQANSCEYTFYGKCVEAAGEGKHELTMYVVDIMGTEYHRVGLITKEQGQQAIKSSAMCYDERDDEDFHRFAKALPKVVALKAADTIKEHLTRDCSLCINGYIIPRHSSSVLAGRKKQVR